jgi:hypothetical protein
MLHRRATGRSWTSRTTAILSAALKRSDRAAGNRHCAARQAIDEATKRCSTRQASCHCRHAHTGGEEVPRRQWQRRARQAAKERSRSLRGFGGGRPGNCASTSQGALTPCRFNRVNCGIRSCRKGSLL